MIKKLILSSVLLCGTTVGLSANANVTHHKNTHSKSKVKIVSNKHTTKSKVKTEKIKWHKMNKKKATLKENREVNKTNTHKEILKNHDFKNKTDVNVKSAMTNMNKIYSYNNIANYYKSFNSNNELKKSKIQHGIASYYGKGFWGKHTASGKIMQKGDMTAAHKTLPLGTKLKVTNEKNGKSVIVTVNDRGPYVGKRVIDLAERPAKILDMKKDGITSVKITPISIPSKDIIEVASYYKKTNKHYRKYHHS